MSNPDWDPIFRETRPDQLASRDSQTTALEEALRVLANAGVDCDELKCMRVHEGGHLGVEGLTVLGISAEIQNSLDGRVNAAINLTLSGAPETLIAAIKAVPEAERSTEDWRELSRLYYESYSSQGSGGD